MGGLEDGLAFFGGGEPDWLDALDPERLDDLAHEVILALGDGPALIADRWTR